MIMLECVWQIMVGLMIAFLGVKVFMLEKSVESLQERLKDK